MPINIQVYLANFSFCTLFISMIFYWIETSQFGKNLSTTTSRIQKNLTPVKLASTSQATIPTIPEGCQMVKKSNNLVLNSPSLSQDFDRQTLPEGVAIFTNNSFLKKLMIDIKSIKDNNYIDEGELVETENNKNITTNLNNALTTTIDKKSSEIILNNIEV